MDNHNTLPNRYHVMSVTEVDDDNTYYPDPEAGSIAAPVPATTGFAWGATASAGGSIFAGSPGLDVIIHQVYLNKVNVGGGALQIRAGAAGASPAAGCSSNNNASGSIVGPFRVAGGFSLQFARSGGAGFITATVTYEIVPALGT